LQASAELISPQTIIGGSQIRQLIGLHEAYAAGKLYRDRHLPQDIVLDYISESVESKISQGKAKAKGLLAKKPHRALGLVVSENADWDTTHFGKRMGKMTLAIFDDTVGHAQRSKLIRDSFEDSELDMVTARVNLGDFATIHALEAEGAILTDVLFSFRFDTTSSNAIITGSKEEIGLARRNDAKALIKLGGSVFTIDRFHADPHIPSKASDQLYSKWVANSLRGLADVVLVARVHEEIAGFITCKLHQINEDCKYGVIDLVAVSPSYRGKGIGSHLVRSALDWFRPRVPTVYVGTQGANLGAIRLYEKSGFSHVCSEATLHLWSQTER